MNHLLSKHDMVHVIVTLPVHLALTWFNAGPTHPDMVLEWTNIGYKKHNVGYKNTILVKHPGNNVDSA